jgi:hypothetical protein
VGLVWLWEVAGPGLEGEQVADLHRRARCAH